MKNRKLSLAESLAYKIELHLFRTRKTGVAKPKRSFRQRLQARLVLKQYTVCSKTWN